MIIYLSLPLTFFHGRFFLLESLTNLFTIFSIYLVTQISSKESLVQKINFKWIFLLAASLCLSYFTKPLAIVSFPTIFLFPVIFLLTNKIPKKNKLSLIKNVAFGLSFGSFILILLYLPIQPLFTRFITDSHSPISLFLNFKKNFYKLIWWSNIYLTKPILIVFLGACLYVLVKRSWKIFWLIFWFLSSLILICLFPNNFFPRHLFPLASPIAALTGVLFNKLFLKYKHISVVALVILLSSFWWLNFQIITNPQNAPIALEDKQLFFQDWTSGVGDKEISQKLQQLSKNGKIYVYVENSPEQIWVFTHLYNEGKSKIIASENLTENKFVENINSSSKNYMILNRNPNPPASWPIHLIYSAQKGPYRSINLFKID